MLLLLVPKIVVLCLKINGLSTAIYDLWPKYLTPEKAWSHALYAVLNATEDWPAERLLAIARVESNFEPTDTSRKDGRTGRRVTSKWRSTSRAAYFVGPYFCGVLQTKALSWSTCIAQREVGYGYRVGVIELTSWMRLCKQKKYRVRDHRCALAGHGGGKNAALRVKKELDHWTRAEHKGRKPKLKPPYWMRVLAREKMLRDHVSSTE